MDTRAPDQYQRFVVDREQVYISLMSLNTLSFTWQRTLRLSKGLDLDGFIDNLSVWLRIDGL